jgi:hypothetical protein
MAVAIGQTDQYPGESIGRWDNRSRKLPIPPARLGKPFRTRRFPTVSSHDPWKSERRVALSDSHGETWVSCLARGKPCLHIQTGIRRP